MTDRDECQNCYDTGNVIYEGGLEQCTACGADPDDPTSAAPSAPASTWDIGDPEPDGVQSVLDHTRDSYDVDNPEWHRTYSGEWKGYKDGNGVYLDWAELVRRWGPVTADEAPT